MSEKRVSKAELARVLDVSVNTVAKHLGSVENPREGAPLPDEEGRYDLDLAVAWVRRGPDPAGGEDSEDPELARLARERKELDNELLRVRIAKLRGELVPEELVVEMLSLHHSVFLQELASLRRRCELEGGKDGSYGQVSDWVEQSTEKVRDGFGAACALLAGAVARQDDA